MNDSRVRILARQKPDNARHLACFGKVKFPSRKNAAARARALPPTEGKGPWNSYHCPRCRHWHVGHSRPWTKPPPLVHG